MSSDQDDEIDSLSTKRISAVPSTASTDKLSEHGSSKKSEHGDELSNSATRFKLMMESELDEGRQGYRDFLQTEYATESLDFLVASENLRKIYLEDDEADEKAVRRAFGFLYCTFILKSAAQSINISAALYDRFMVLSTNLDNATASKQQIVGLITEAQKEISNILVHGSFPRYETSSSAMATSTSTLTSTSTSAMAAIGDETYTI